MKRIMYLAVLMGIAACLHAQATISLASTNLDFDTLYNGQEVARSTYVFNRGNATLTIDQLNAPCSCSKPSMTTRSIAPGDSAELTVLFNGKMFQGPVHKQILLVSNDPVSRNTFVDIRASVKPVFRLVPGTVVLASSGAPETTRVRLTNMCAQPVTISEAEDAGHRLGLCLIPEGAIRPGEGLVLEVVFSGTISEPVAGKIRLRLKGAPVSELEVPYIIRRVPPEASKQ